jgi:hypothetical protein
MEIVFESTSQSQPSVIDCCESYSEPRDVNIGQEHFHNPNEFSNVESSRYTQLELMIRSMDEKHKRALFSANEEWKAKFELYDSKFAHLTHELAETRRRLQTQEGNDYAKTYSPIDADCSSYEDSGDSMDSAVDDTCLPRTLVLDKNLLRGNHSDGGGNENSNGSMLQDSEISQQKIPDEDKEKSCESISIEGLIRNEMQLYTEQVMAQRDVQFDFMQQELAEQSRRVMTLQEEVSNAMMIIDSIRSEKVEAGQPGYTELEILVPQIQKLRDLVTTKNSRTPLHCNILSLANVNESSPQPTKQELADLIQNESERLMKTWGVQFDDLTAYVQDILDTQRACIAEARTSTFDHVDAEAQRRTVAWNAQFHQLFRQSHQHENAIQLLRDDQERSFLNIVETLVKLKTKFQSISDKMDEYEIMQLSSEVDMSEVRRNIAQESKVSQLNFKRYEGKLHLLKVSMDRAMKEIEDIAEDRESIQTILTASVELFNAKADASVDLWNNQFAGLEKKTHEKIDSGQLHIHNLNQHRYDIDHVVTAMCKKMVELTDRTVYLINEIEFLKKTTRDEEAKDDYRPSSVEVVRDDTIIKYIKVDQKKYKKILWNARQQIGQLCAENDKNEIEFYDLTFALTSE